MYSARCRRLAEKGVCNTPRQTQLYQKLDGQITLPLDLKR